MTWTLVILFGITWAGPAGSSTSQYPNEESCYRALASLKLPAAQVAESQNRRDTIAFCRPTGVVK